MKFAAQENGTKLQNCSSMECGQELLSSQNPGDLGYGISWGEGESKEDDEGFHFST
jgi:hypothetical protein